MHRTKPGARSQNQLALDGAPLGSIDTPRVSDSVDDEASLGIHRARAANIRVVGLKADYLDRPIGLHNTQPLLSWRLESSSRGSYQSAYRILVATSDSLLQRGQPDLWDSGKIVSRKSVAIGYRGKPLQSRQGCWWRVEAWDQNGVASGGCETGYWEMGLLSPTDWKARWLSADDAVTRADRDAPLAWAWGSQEEDESECSRKFRYSLVLSSATSGGVLFLAPRSYEQIAGVWIDDAPIRQMTPAVDLVRERISLGRLAAGPHLLAIEVRRKNPLPESFGPKQSAGIAVFARFDHPSGESTYLPSTTRCRTETESSARWFERQFDDSPWTEAQTSPIERGVVPEPAMIMRRRFVVDETVTRARLYVTSLGCYEARLNGERVGDALLTPEVSDYSKRVLYQTYDVKELLHTGANVIGLLVGDGWYASHPGRYAWGSPPRRALAQLELTFASGRQQFVTTGPEWQISSSAIQQSEICYGELYDARLEQPGWDREGFENHSWSTAQIADSPSGQLIAQVSQPIRIVDVLKPQRVTSVAPGIHVYDFGQNFAGWCRLRVNGPSGLRVELRFGERLLASGEVDQFVLLGRKAVDAYILRGAPAGEVFEPHFTYHGFRYVQLTGMELAPACDSLDGIVISNDLALTAQLRSDNALVQQLWRNIVWTQRSNFVAVATDCPNRDERMCYLGDTNIFWDSAAFNMDVAAFTRRIMDSVRDAQHANGALSPLATGQLRVLEIDHDDPSASAAWTDGGVILPWTVWRRYGDLGVIEQNWECMNRYLQFIERNNPDYLWTRKCSPKFGDWLAIGAVNEYFYPRVTPTTPYELIATAYWARSADLLSQMAQATQRASDAQRLREVWRRVRDAFIARFVSSDGTIGSGSQTSYLLALAFDLLPEERRSAAVAQLVRATSERGPALSTGIVGTQFSLDVLADSGHPDIAYSLLLRRTYPSWGYMIDNGATTIWERWDGSLQRIHATASHSHFALGSVCGFLFRRLAGIEAAAPGFEKIRINPLPDRRIKRGGGDYHSVMGTISTDWEQTDREFRLNVTIPPNTVADVYIPASQHATITEGQTEIGDCDDIRVVTRNPGVTVVEVGSGSYRFSAR